MSIAKVDVDVKMSKELLTKFVNTRLAIAQRLGYAVKGCRVVETKKGYHLWMEIFKKLTDKELCELQFLLGDDQVRCRFNFLRLDLGAFGWFNALFSKKMKRKRKR